MSFPTIRFTFQVRKVMIGVVAYRIIVSAPVSVPLLRRWILDIGL